MMLLRKTLAAVAFTAAAMISAAAAGADELGFISFSIVGKDECNTFLRADLSPMMDGKPLMVRFGAQPFTGPYIGGTMAHSGMNLFAVPNPHQPGWYTAECAGLREPEEDGVGFN